MEIESHIYMVEVRKLLGAIFAVVGLSTLSVALTLYSLLFMDQTMKVAGPPILNTMAVVYLLPALVLIAGWLLISNIPAQLRIAMQGLSGASVALWAFASVRHFWQGA